MTLYGAMLACFDALSDAKRTDLVELDTAWASCSGADQALLLALARRLAGR